MAFDPAVITTVLGLLKGVGHPTPSPGLSGEAVKVAGVDDAQDVRIVALETRVATLERSLRLLLESRR